MHSLGGLGSEIPLDLAYSCMYVSLSYLLLAVDFCIAAFYNGELSVGVFWVVLRGWGTLLSYFRVRRRAVRGSLIL